MISNNNHDMIRQNTKKEIINHTYQGLHLLKETHITYSEMQVHYHLNYNRKIKNMKTMIIIRKFKLCKIIS